MEKLREDWEDLAKFDPYWAILADGKKKFHKWNLDEFFQTRQQEIESVLRTAEGLSRPARKQKALDFGCGVGRLTRALALHFDSVIGVDLSETMIATAKELN